MKCWIMDMKNSKKIKIIKRNWKVIWWKKDDNNNNEIKNNNNIEIKNNNIIEIIYNFEWNQKRINIAKEMKEENKNENEH